MATWNKIVRLGGFAMTGIAGAKNNELQKLSRMLYHASGQTNYQSGEVSTSYGKVLPLDTLNNAIQHWEYMRGIGVVTRQEALDAYNSRLDDLDRFNILARYRSRSAHGEGWGYADEILTAADTGWRWQAVLGSLAFPLFTAYLKYKQVFGNPQAPNGAGAMALAAGAALGGAVPQLALGIMAANQLPQIAMHGALNAAANNQGFGAAGALVPYNGGQPYQGPVAGLGVAGALAGVGVAIGAGGPLALAAGGGALVVAGGVAVAAGQAVDRNVMFEAIWHGFGMLRDHHGKIATAYIAAKGWNLYHGPRPPLGQREHDNPAMNVGDNRLLRGHPDHVVNRERYWINKTYSDTPMTLEEIERRGFFDNIAEHLFPKFSWVADGRSDLSEKPVYEPVLTTERMNDPLGDEVNGMPEEETLEDMVV